MPRLGADADPSVPDGPPGGRLRCPPGASYRAGVAERSPDDVTKAAKDSVYVAVGLSAMAFQRLQVRRREIEAQLAAIRDGRADDGAAKALGDNLKMIDEKVRDAEERLDAVLDEVEERLPEPARQAMAVSRSVAKGVRDQLRELL